MSAVVLRSCYSYDPWPWQQFLVQRLLDCTLNHLLLELLRSLQWHVFRAVKYRDTDYWQPKQGQFVKSIRIGLETPLSPWLTLVYVNGHCCTLPSYAPPGGQWPLRGPPCPRSWPCLPPPCPGGRTHMSWSLDDTWPRDGAVKTKLARVCRIVPLKATYNSADFIK